MAKSGVFEGDPSTVVRASELKRELQKLLKAIVDEDGDVNLDTVDRAQQMLFVLKELKLKKTTDLKLRQPEPAPVVVPEEFKCPLSKELMRDPVIVSTGQTYERAFIQRWLKSGKRTCPETQQVLSYTTLVPNHLIRGMIMQWCKNHGIKLEESSAAKYIDEDGVTEVERNHFTSLLEKMSSTLPEQKEAAQELRLMTKRTPSVRALFGQIVDAVPQLVNPLTRAGSDSKAYQGLQEDIVTTLLNISIHDNNKKHVAETPAVIPILIDAVRSGTVETRSNAAAAIFTLAALDSNKDMIGKAGAMKPLIELLDEGNLFAMKDAATAIYNMCLLDENKVRAVRDGAVGVVMKKIKSKTHVDELVTLLTMFSVNGKAVEEMIELGAVPCLFSIIRETPSARTKENCIVILHIICFSDRTTWNEIREEQNAHQTITQLARNGTSRAKRKANGILERLNRAHTT